MIAALNERLAAPPLALPAPGAWPSLDQASDEYRRVTFSAEFDHGREALVYAAPSALRPDASGPGYWIFTPARLAGGGVVIVNRGFVPQADREGRCARPRPSGGAPRDRRRPALAGEAYLVFANVTIRTAICGSPGTRVRSPPPRDLARTWSAPVLCGAGRAGAARRIAAARQDRGEPARTNTCNMHSRGSASPSSSWSRSAFGRSIRAASAPAGTPRSGPEGYLRFL